jgi:hypothetical protein
VYIGSLALQPTMHVWQPAPASTVVAGIEWAAHNDTNPPILKSLFVAPAIVAPFNARQNALNPAPPFALSVAVLEMSIQQYTGTSTRDCLVQCAKHKNN